MDWQRVHGESKGSLENPRGSLERAQRTHEDPMASLENLRRRLRGSLKDP